MHMAGRPWPPTMIFHPLFSLEGLKQAGLIHMALDR